jgi:hypothetical protein
MSGLCRFTGHGSRVELSGPFRAWRVAQILHLDGGLTFTPSESGVLVTGIGDQGALERGGAEGGWRIENSVYSVRWPEGFQVVSTQEFPGFELLGPDQEYVSFQGPALNAALPRVQDAAGPGQTVVDSGDDWVELAYEHEGAAWIQRVVRVQVVPEAFLLVFGQGLATQRQVVVDGAMAVARSVHIQL